MLNCSHGKALKTIRELEDKGLIKRKKQGQGKPSIVYVKLVEEADFLKSFRDGRKAMSS